ncbi:trans-sialidase, putative, partial [Trypanosoma cruzi marinkellei]
YNSEKKWKLLCGDTNAKEDSRDWESKKTQHVVILLRNGTRGSAYVDGKHVGDVQCEWENNEDKNISHFYIGGDGGSAGSEKDVSVTVKNVLLYNRQLDETEVKALNANKVPIPNPEERKAEVGDASSAKVSAPAAQGTVSSSAPGGPRPSEEESLRAVNGANGQGEGQIPPQEGDVNAAALSSSLGNVSHGKNGDASTVSGSGILPSLLLLLLGLWGLRLCEE